MSWGSCLCSHLLSAPRLTGLEEPVWGDEDTEHNYYNSVPGKEPPLGGLVDSRLTLTQPCALGAFGTLSQVSLWGLTGEGLAGPSPDADTLGLVPSFSFCSSLILNGFLLPQPSLHKLHRYARPCSHTSDVE